MDIDNKYFHKFKHGNLYFYLILPKILPLLLWGLFVYKYYIPYYKSCKNCSPLFLLILFIPVIIIAIEFILNKESILSHNTGILGNWPQCSKISESKNKDILGTYDYNCDKSQITKLQQLSTQLQYKFYYLNASLFLLILIFNNLTKLHKKSLKNYNIVFIAITLFIGILGILPSSYDDNYTWSLIIMMGFGTILNMNIAAFLAVLYSLF